jgi:hypothetical protein
VKEGKPPLTGRVEIQVMPSDVLHDITLIIQDNAYGNEKVRSVVANGQAHRVAVETARSFGWYDLRISLADVPGFAKRYAGRVEVGKPSVSDPAMGLAGPNPTLPK